MKAYKFDFFADYTHGNIVSIGEAYTVNYEATKSQSILYDNPNKRTKYDIEPFYANGTGYALYLWDESEAALTGLCANGSYACRGLYLDETHANANSAISALGLIESSSVISGKITLTKSIPTTVSDQSVYGFFYPYPITVNGESYSGVAVTGVYNNSDSGASSTGWKSTKSGKFVYIKLDGSSASTVTPQTNDVIDFGTTEHPIYTELLNYLLSMGEWEQPEVPTVDITYDGNTVASLEDGKTATLECAGKKAKSDIVAVFGCAGSITYNGKTTEVEAGKTATLACAGKKMLSDVVVAA